MRVGELIDLRHSLGDGRVVVLAAQAVGCHKTEDGMEVDWLVHGYRLEGPWSDEAREEWAVNWAAALAEEE